MCVLYTSYGCSIGVYQCGFLQGHFLKDARFVPTGFRHCCGYAEGLFYFLLLLLLLSTKWLIRRATSLVGCILRGKGTLLKILHFKRERSENLEKCVSIATACVIILSKFTHKLYRFLVPTVALLVKVAFKRATL